MSVMGMAVSNGKYSRQQRYNAANTTQVTLRLNKRTESDIIDQLNSKGNKQGYIKELIRRDMEGRTA